jgi:hypothetical protein
VVDWGSVDLTAASRGESAEDCAGEGPCVDEAYVVASGKVEHLDHSKGEDTVLTASSVYYPRNTLILLT